MLTLIAKFNCSPENREISSCVSIKSSPTSSHIPFVTGEMFIKLYGLKEVQRF